MKTQDKGDREAGAEEHGRRGDEKNGNRGNKEQEGEAESQGSSLASCASRNLRRMAFISWGISVGAVRPISSCVLL